MKTVQTSNASWTLKDGELSLVVFSGSKIVNTVAVKEAEARSAFLSLFGSKKETK